MSDKLVFYSKSADKKAGKGVHENVSSESDYEELNKIKDWRRILSNFHTYPFKYEGKTYNSIEHAFQARKIALADPVKALEFTVESKTELGLGTGADAQKKRKLVKLNTKQIKEWDNSKDHIMEEIAIEKYKVCKEAQKVLKHTNNAQLWHLVTSRGKASQLIRFKHLEEFRSQHKS